MPPQSSVQLPVSKKCDVRQWHMLQGPPAPPPTISLDGTPVASSVPTTPPDAAAIHAAGLLAEVISCVAFDLRFFQAEVLLPSPASYLLFL